MAVVVRRLLIAATTAKTLDSFARPQLPYLREAGWQITLVASEHAAVDLAGVDSRVVRMTRQISPIDDTLALARWRRLLDQVQPDVILGSTPKAGLLSMMAGRMAGVPVRIFLNRGARWETENGWRRRLLLQSDRLTMRNATHNLAVSNSLASLALSQGLVVERPTVLGAGGSKGVDRSRFIPGPNRAGGEPVLGFLGRLASDKGIDTLLEVFGAVRAVYPDSRLIVGGRVDPSQPISPKTLNELRATTGVEYVGGVNDAPEFFRGIDLLVYPSSREGLPNVVIEAAACGVPVVGWDVTGVRDAIEVGRTGMVVPFGDTPALSQSAVDWATPSAEVRAACREWSASFDQVALAEHLVNFLEQV